MSRSRSNLPDRSSQKELKELKELKVYSISISELV